MWTLWPFIHPTKTTHFFIKTVNNVRWGFGVRSYHRYPWNRESVTDYRLRIGQNKFWILGYKTSIEYIIRIVFFLKWGVNWSSFVTELKFQVFWCILNVVFVVKEMVLHVWLLILLIQYRIYLRSWCKRTLAFFHKFHFSLAFI